MDKHTQMEICMKDAGMDIALIESCLECFRMGEVGCGRQKLHAHRTKLHMYLVIVGYKIFLEGGQKIAGVHDLCGSTYQNLTDSGCDRRCLPIRPPAVLLIDLQIDTEHFKAMAEHAIWISAATDKTDMALEQTSPWTI